ncbi:hypothetical protein AB0J80_36930 [Actinoplanes sp. NPDC049548]|uniref:hypothetical protein n=1 Tax=Actinoplanes sp. NPDC049548 TaxID=3155152 RepID=UPI00341C972D
MAALLPRLFGDMGDWFEMELPRPTPVIRFEDKVSDKEYVLRAELPAMEPDKDVQIMIHDDQAVTACTALPRPAASVAAQSRARRPPSEPSTRATMR